MWGEAVRLIEKGAVCDSCFICTVIVNWSGKAMRLTCVMNYVMSPTCFASVRDRVSYWYYCLDLPDALHAICKKGDV